MSKKMETNLYMLCHEYFVSKDPPSLQSKAVFLVPFNAISYIKKDVLEC